MPPIHLDGARSKLVETSADINIVDGLPSNTSPCSSPLSPRTARFPALTHREAAAFLESIESLTTTQETASVTDRVINYSDRVCDRLSTTKVENGHGRAGRRQGRVHHGRSSRAGTQSRGAAGARGR